MTTTMFILTDQERDLMVRQQIEPWGVYDQAVLAAFRSVVREEYLPEELAFQAYHDKSIELENTEMLACKILARMFQSLQIKSTDKLLLVGVGPGYGYAIAKKLTANVLGVEIDADMYDKAQKNLTKQQVPQIEISHEDGHNGLASKGPYDKILFTGAFEIFPPTSLFEQLSQCGKCFFFCQADEVQHGYLVERQGDNFKESLHFESFVPFLKNIPRRSTFVL